MAVIRAITFGGTKDQTITTPAGWTDVLEGITIGERKATQTWTAA